MKIAWHNQQRNIILAQVSEIQNWETIYQGHEQIAQLLSNRANGALILKVASDVLLPTDGFSEFAATIMARHDKLNLNPIIIVTRSSSVPRLWQAAISLYAQPHQRYYFVNSIEEAEAILTTNSLSSAC